MFLRLKYLKTLAFSFEDFNSLKLEFGTFHFLETSIYQRFLLILSAGKIEYWTTLIHRRFYYHSPTTTTTPTTKQP